MSSYEQGEFDSLCGIYAILNAIKLVDKKVDGEKLFEQMVKELHNQDKLKDALIEGTKKKYN